MRRPPLLFAAALVVLTLVLLAVAPALAHHKPGHKRGPTTTTLPATTTTGASLPTTTVGLGPCAAPLTISTGGYHVGGCYESRNPAVPAIEIATAQPVYLDRVLYRHAGVGIASSVSGVQLTLTNSTEIRLDPGSAQDGRAIRLQQANLLVVEHNRFVDGDGIYWLGSAASPTVGRVRYNEAFNIGRYKNGLSELVQFFQTDNVALPGLEVAWNHTINVFQQSEVEDNINLYQTTGSSGNPIQVHHNLIDGAFPTTAGGGYTGGGIIAGDAGGSWTSIHHNTVVATVNYGVAISGGHDCTLTANRVVGRSRAHDGTLMTAGNVGFYVWNHATDPLWANNTSVDNVSGWLNGSLARNDWWLPDDANQPNGINNSSLGGTVDATAEQAERDAWDAARVAAGVTVGPLP